MGLFFRGLCKHSDTCDSKKVKTPVVRAHARERELEGLEKLEALEILEGLEILEELEKLETLERLAFACGELLEEIGILRFQFCDDSI